MVRRLCILCFLVALWPGLALAQSAALMEASKQYKALYEKGRYGEAERFARKALELSQREFGPDHPTTATFLNNLAALHQVQGRYAEATSAPWRSWRRRWDQTIRTSPPALRTTPSCYGQLDAPPEAAQADGLETEAGLSTGPPEVDTNGSIGESV